jgi:hypothetical protein
VRLLLRNADLFQHVQYGLALHLKLSGQIIDSNFHPFSVPSSCPLSVHMDLTLKSDCFLLLFLLARLVTTGSFVFWNVRLV